MDDAQMRLARIIVIIWVILWINFMARDLFKSGYLRDYKILITRDAEGKRAYAYGDRFYEFLKFAKRNLPSDAHYDFVGVLESIDSRRGIYYLYPSLKKENPDFLLVYDEAVQKLSLRGGSGATDEAISDEIASLATLARNDESEFSDSLYNGAARKGYDLYARLDEERFILKRR